MSTIFIGHGVTGSGKTEVANYLEEHYGIYHYHPIGFMKRFEERLCNLPAGSLDLPEGKSTPIPGNEEKTMQELMVAMYHFFKEWMPGRSTLNMRIQLPELLEQQDVCVVALRNVAEVHALVDIKNAGNHNLVVFNLHRQSAKRETSDENYEVIRDMLWGHATLVLPVNNNFNLDHLHSTLDDVVRLYPRH